MLSIKFKKYVPCILLALFAFVSCKKGGNPTVTHPTVPPSYPVVNTNADVYLVGTTTAAYPNNIPLATYWKNGVASILADGSPSFNSEADAIALNGPDVYIAGQTHIGTNLVATVWKNGVVTQLAGNVAASRAVAIAISGNDIYSAGSATASYGGIAATYWKNGVTTMVPGSTAFDTEANAIAVNGADVYMAGFTFPWGMTPSYYEATYWKNGVATILSTNPSGSVANGIAVIGTDVYVVGFIANVATIWKNGRATSLGDAAPISMANAIAINGTDIYVAGYINDVAVYWKNGVATMLTFGSPITNENLANAIALNGSNVFVAGGFDTPGNNSFYWWNGMPVKLDGGLSILKGIAIVPH